MTLLMAVLLALAGAAFGALIATPIAYDRGRDRANRDAISPEGRKWDHVTFAKWPDDESAKPGE